MMARKIGNLTALGVPRAKEGYHADGGGLLLQVTSTGARSWVYRFMLNGRAREMGLGSVNAVTLAQARTKAAECRSLRANGVDPIEARKAQRAKAVLAEARAITFKTAAEA